MSSRRVGVGGTIIIRRRGEARVVSSSINIILFILYSILTPSKNIGPLVSALMLMSDVSSSPPTFLIQAERKRHCLLHRLRPLILHVLEVVHIVMVPCWKATDSRDGRLVSKTMFSHSF